MCTKHLFLKLILALSLISITVSAQKKWNDPLFQKDDWVVYGAQYLTGISSGVREEVIYHPVQLFEMYPNLNKQWWDIRVSYTNKYHESPLFVAFSDANHFFKSCGLITNCVSVGFSFGDLGSYDKKQRWKVIAKKILFSYISNKLGFATSYYLYYKNHLLP